MMKEEDPLWNWKVSFIWDINEHMQRKVEKGKLFPVYLANY